MAFENLSQQAAIWQNLGLNYLLLPHAASPESGGVFSKFLSKEPEKAPPRTGSAAQPPQRPYFSGNSPDINREERQRATRKQPDWSAQPLESWPEGWRNLFESGRIQPGKVAWSYYRLGLDLLSCDNAAEPGFMENRDKRRALLSQLLAYMAKPQGTHTFWPVTLPSDNGQINRACFWSGLNAFKCRVVVIMGQDAASQLLGARCIPLCLYQSPVRGCSALVLKDIEALFNRPDYSASINFLQKAFPALFDPSK